MKMERIKTFLSIKQRPVAKKKLLELDGLLEDLNFRFLKANKRIDELERAKESAYKINTDLNNQILKRVDIVAQQTKNIQIERIHSKGELFNSIAKEMDDIHKAHTIRVANLEKQVHEFKKQAKMNYVSYLNLKSELEREKEMCDKGTQLQLENIINFTNFDELENWRSSLNNFIIEGRDLGQDWGNVVLSDLLSSRLVSEWFIHKERRPICHLK